MKKFLGKLILVLAVVAAAVNYGLYLRTGHYPISEASVSRGLGSAVASVQRWRAANISWPTPLTELPSLPSLPTRPGQTESPKSTTAYTWVDNKGVKHYADKAPENTPAVRRLDINPDTNIIQGTGTVPAAAQEKTEGTPVTATTANRQRLENMSTANPAAAQQADVYLEQIQDLQDGDDDTGDNLRARGRITPDLTRSRLRPER